MEDKTNKTPSSENARLKTIIICTVLLFILIVAIVGGSIPVLLLMAVLCYVWFSGKKQFGKKLTDLVDEDLKDDDEPDSLTKQAETEKVIVESKTSESFAKETLKKGKASFDDFMLSRFGLSKADVRSVTDKNKTEDAGPTSDDLYDADQYESVNEDLSDTDPNVLTVNGRKTKFKHKDNPFEM